MIVTLIWWIASAILFYRSYRSDGLVKALINWVNPLTPP